MNDLIKAGTLVTVAFIDGTAGIARNTVTHNTGPLRHTSVLAGEPGQGATRNGFSWG
jgi:hypothetical protein